MVGIAKLEPTKAIRASKNLSMAAEVRYVPLVHADVSVWRLEKFLQRQCRTWRKVGAPSLPVISAVARIRLVLSGKNAAFTNG